VRVIVPLMVAPLAGVGMDRIVVRESAGGVENDTQRIYDYTANESRTGQEKVGLGR